MHNDEANRSAKEQRTRNKKGLTVIVRHIAAPDAKQRLSRVVGILMKAAARSTPASGKSTITEEKKTLRYAPSEERLAEAEKGQLDV